MQRILGDTQQQLYHASVAVPSSLRCVRGIACPPRLLQGSCFVAPLISLVLHNSRKFLTMHLRLFVCFRNLEGGCWWGRSSILPCFAYPPHTNHEDIGSRRTVECGPWCRRWSTETCSLHFRNDKTHDDEFPLLPATMFAWPHSVR